MRQNKGRVDQKKEETGLLPLGWRDRKDGGRECRWWLETDRKEMKRMMRKRRRPEHERT